MEILKRLFFGKKVEIDVPLVGKLHCRINNKHPNAIYGWRKYDNSLLPGASLLLEGNFEGPFERHIKNWLEIINHIDDIVEVAMTRFLTDNPTYQSKSLSKDDFNIISIICSGQLTVSLIILTPNKGGYSINWREGKVQSIR